ncbi:ribosomal RNA small subunit methyltransferase H [Bacteroidota bacterium]|nr:ribosomal RNA small subunit methyltransferase H [Bacteroidota bacterium]
MLPHMQKGEQKKSDQSSTYHVPVLLKEAVDALQIKSNGVYVDCTFGGGGHAREILGKLGEGAKLIAFDQDADAKKNIPADTRILFIPHNFRHLSKFLRLHQISHVDGILADLGVSSHQFDEPTRGFSIRFDAPLDMRMDQSSELTASQLIQKLSAAELQWIFQEYGEVSNAKTLAHLLTEHGSHAPIKTIEEFKAVIAPVIKGNPNKYLAQVFQALRMAVNDELGALKDLLSQSLEVLAPGGRIAIITFHSIEDRMVKQFFKTGDVEQVKIDPVFGTKESSPLNPISKKPIEPTAEEIKNNPRSRSARLRVAEKK